VYILSYVQKTVKQDDENSAVQCRIETMCCRPNFMALYARSFTGYILQYKSEEHWKLKIISITAEGT